jgi:hypothetical protein
LQNFIRVVDNILFVVVRGMGSESERLGRLKPEEKVAVAVDMTDACVRVCAAGIRAQYPSISEEELLAKLRERAVKDEEDVKAILKFAMVDVETVKRRARKDGTLAILEGLIE